MSEFEIDLQSVTFTYEDGVEALSDLSLQARQGEFVVVLGANGAGKSTLCYLLSGIVPHIFRGTRSGRFSIAGKDPWDEPIFETSRHCGVLLQDPEVQLFNPTVFTEMIFGPANLGVPREEILRRVEESMKLLHLVGLDERNPRDLSGGQKQRTALGAVLCMRPRVLVLDEPTSQLDPLGRWEVVDAIHRLKSTGQMTIVMTTHETDDILDLADQVLVLDQGRIILHGSPAEVFSHPQELAQAGIKVPDTIEILNGVCQIAGEPLQLTDEQVRVISAERVADQTLNFIRQGQLEVAPYQPRAKSTVNDNSQDFALEAENLTFQYPGYPPVLALSEINVSIRRGEFVGIIGQNGSGKSTLVKCFVGLLRPTKGVVRVNGKDILNTPVGEMSREIGLVLQNPDYQLFTISSKEEVYFGLRNIGVIGQEAEDRMLEVLRWVGLEKEIETFPFRMSFGDRRKLTVAATIALNPQVLILDEPTTAQDHRGRYQLADIGQRFRDEHGRTVVMITHDMDLVARYVDRLIVMWNGQVLLDGPTAQVFSQVEELRRSFLRPPVAAQVATALQSVGISGNVVTTEDLLGHLKRRAH